MNLIASKLKKTLIWEGMTETEDLVINEYYLYEEAFSDEDFKIEPKSYTPKKGDRIHFMPDCTVPRIKVKSYCDKHDLSMCKHEKDANVVFYGPGSIQNMFMYRTHMHVYKVSVDMFRKFINQIYSTGNIKALRIDAKLAQVEEDFVLVLSSLIEWITGEEALPWGAIVYGLEINDEEQKDYDHRKIKDMQSYTALKHIAKLDSVYVSQDAILSELNDVTMDESMYNSISMMLQSEDTDNHIIAMEAMANCNYRNSAVYLLLLFKNHGGVISQQKTRKHVNFQSLLAYFDITNMYVHPSIDAVMEILRDMKLLTRKNLNLLMPIVERELTPHLQSDVFEPSGIQLKKEYVDCITDDIVTEEADNDIAEGVEALVPREEDPIQCDPI